MADHSIHRGVTNRVVFRCTVVAAREATRGLRAALAQQGSRRSGALRLRALPGGSVQQRRRLRRRARPRRMRGSRDDLHVDACRAPRHRSHRRFRMAGSIAPALARSRARPRLVHHPIDDGRGALYARPRGKQPHHAQSAHIASRAGTAPASSGGPGQRAGSLAGLRAHFGGNGSRTLFPLGKSLGHFPLLRRTGTDQRLRGLCPATAH